MARRRQTAPKESGNRKLRKLNEEALKIVDEKAVQIAKSLLDSTLEGHILSARLLVELAEGNVEADEAMTMRPLRSVAMGLAEEPQWQDEAPDPAAETQAADSSPSD